MRNILLFSFLILFVGCTSELKYPIKAKILSVNGRVLKGKLSANFLSGTSGKFGDTNILGLKFKCYPNDKYRYKDIEVSFSLLAHYEDSDSIDFELLLKREKFLMLGRCRGWINLIDDIYNYMGTFDSELFDSIEKYVENK